MTKSKVKVRDLATYGSRLFRRSEVRLSDPNRAAARRLGLSGLVIASTGLFYLILIFLIRLFGGEEIAIRLGLSNAIISVTIICSLLSLMVYVFSRTHSLPAQRMLDLGLVYQICLAIIMGIIMKLLPGPMRMPGHWGVSEICILILLFPVIIPNSAWKTLTAALICASTDPIGVYWAASLGKEMPPVSDLVFVYSSNYICAGLALVPALVITRLGRQITQAREMGSYRLLERLGKGGMGEVWRASHRLLAREAAVKIIRPESLGSGGDGHHLIQRFEREAQATANLHSTHSIQLYDFGVTDEGVFFYVMELLDGLDLASYVKRYGPMPANRVVAILRQVCHSLTDAHKSGLIHRDIKPANIFVCRYGHEVDHVKVLDFGLVRTTESPAESDPKLTVVNSFTGTPAYMAPEMAFDSHHVDHRADIYSLGCVAYWLLTGCHVFRRETPLETLGAHLKDSPLPPSQVTELSISADLEQLVLVMLAKKPDQRPVSTALIDEKLAQCKLPVWSEVNGQDWWETHMQRAD
jgi:eukaryotic-like serine/threonine-protein kinase